MRSIEKLRGASREVVRRLGLLNESDREVELSFSEGHILMELEVKGALNCTALSELLNCNKSSVSRTLSRLLRRRFITEKVDTRDARKKLYSLSSIGQEKLALLHRTADMRVQEALSFLSQTEIDTVVNGMILYSSALEKSQQKHGISSRSVGRHLEYVLG